MCGINGIINLPLVKPEESIQKMNASLSHRGPDAKGFFYENDVLLGHTRLSIIDLSAEANQPFYSEDNNYVIVYNGEVYNFEEIKKKYNLTCKTTSDTEVILKAFLLKGIEIFNELNGMFALAIYNKMDQSFCLARDRMGKKPLYYYQQNNTLVFSSEIKALLTLSEIKNKLHINPIAVSSFLHLGYIPSPETIYKEIKKFPSGNSACFKNGILSFKSFWKAEDKITKEIIRDENSALIQLDDLLNSSVSLRLKSDVPFGTFLSGGIDSSLVTALAQKNSNQKINSFSIGFQEKSHNEAVFAREISKQIGTQHHEFIVSEKDAMAILPDMLSAYDEPFADSSAIPMMLVSKLARQEVKMTLSGDGGDELFHGYGFYNWANRLNNPLIKLLKSPIAMGLNMGNNRMKRASTLFTFPKENLKSHIFSQEQYYFSEAELQNLMGEKYTAIPSELNQSKSLARNLSPSEQQSLFDIKYYLKDDLLTKVDIATMKYGLENRVPLLDYRVVEFALNLSPDLKIKNGEQKYLLKQLLYQYVPKTLFDRPKQGFSIPLASWLKGDLKHLIHEHLNQKNIENFGWVKWSEVQKLVTRFNKGENYLYTRIWALIVLHYWLASHE